MNIEQAQIIKILEGLAMNLRNPYFLAMRLNKSYSGIYTNLKMLESVNYITVVKSEMTKKSFYKPTPEGLELANEVLKEMEGELQK